MMIEKKMMETLGNSVTLQSQDYLENKSINCGELRKPLRAKFSN